MKILIVGAGKVGATLASYLSREGHDITIIDNNDAAIHRASETLDVMCLKGPGAVPSVLREAGAEEADLVLATTNMDEVNMLCALTSKRLGAKYTIARIRDVAYTDDLASLQRDLNIDAVINPEYATATEISRLLRFPAAANVDTFFRGKVEMIGVVIREEDHIVGRPLSDLFGKTRGILFSAAERKSEVIIPNGSFVPQVGDKLYITGTPKDLSAYLRSLGRDVPKIHSVFIIGGSRIALYLARQLMPMGIRVTLVETNEANCHLLSELLPGALVLHGDGTDQELLASEHFTNNDAFVALTGRDEDNLISSLYARQQGIRKVIAKSNRENYTAVVQEAGLDSVVAPKLLTVGRILRLVRGLQDKSGNVMTSLYRIADTGAEAAEFILRETTPCLGIPLMELPIRKGFLIAALLHEEKVVIPSGTTVLSAGDRVIVISHGKGIQRFADILETDRSKDNTP
ncbi:MAG: Trk system potassium transporter TrkA [Ruminiclostridium sp.]|nr:Trk system potassium transporter TrkA [Ruminiclostridium sp.]